MAGIAGAENGQNPGTCKTPGLYSVPEAIT